MPVEAETGVSYGDLDEQYMTARFCVALNQAEFNKLSAFIRNLQATTKKWHAGTYNCNSFASDIAKAAGLDSPNPNAYMPDVFIKRMADLNANRSKPATGPGIGTGRGLELAELLGGIGIGPCSKQQAETGGRQASPQSLPRPRSNVAAL